MLYDSHRFESSHITHQVFHIQSVDSSFKTPIQTTTTMLNTADESPMMALGMPAFHFRISDFKLTHTFIICNRLPDTEILFGIDIQKKNSFSYAWDKEKNCYIQKDNRFLTYTRNCKQKATIGIVKSTLKIPPRHNIRNQNKAADWLSRLVELPHDRQANSSDAICHQP